MNPGYKFNEDYESDLQVESTGIASPTQNSVKYAGTSWASDCDSTSVTYFVRQIIMKPHVKGKYLGRGFGVCLLLKPVSVSPSGYSS